MLLLSLLETFYNQVDTTEVGDNHGILNRGVTNDQIRRDLFLAKTNVFEIRKLCLGEIFVLKRDMGGCTKPFVSGYRPQYFSRTVDLTVDVTLLTDIAISIQNDNLTIDMKLHYSLEGQRFALRKGVKTVLLE